MISWIKLNMIDAGLKDRFNTYYYYYQRKGMMPSSCSTFAVHYKITIIIIMFWGEEGGIADISGRQDDSSNPPRDPFSF